MRGALQLPDHEVVGQKLGRNAPMSQPSLILPMRNAGPALGNASRAVRRALGVHWVARL